jgi:deazaflavin-dependent oxidoreductase (nitroreductase family)
MIFNPVVRWVLDSPIHRVLSANTLLLSYVGRKSGRAYVTPVNYVQCGDTFFVTSLRTRLWWRNLRGGADVRLTVRGKQFAAHAIVVEDEQLVADELERYFNSAPTVAKFYRVKRMSDGHFDVFRIAEIALETVMVKCMLRDEMQEPMFAVDRQGTPLL